MSRDSCTLLGTQVDVARSNTAQLVSEIIQVRREGVAEGGDERGGGRCTVRAGAICAANRRGRAIKVDASLQQLRSAKTPVWEPESV